MIVDLEEGVEQKQLADGVGKIHEFDGHVAGDQVVAIQLPANDAAHLGDEVFDAHHAAGSIFTLSEKVAIHLVHDVSNRLHTQHVQLPPS